MTQSTYLWTYVLGSEVYSSNKINSFFTAGFNTNLYGGVLPGKLDDLQVIGGFGGGVTVKPGLAVLRNLLFISDENVSLSCAPNTTTTNRFDYVVLRADLLNKTCRLMIVEGTHLRYLWMSEYDTTVDAVDKKLILEDQNLDMILAIVTMPAGATFVQDYYVKDERSFVPIHEIGQYSNSNLLRNSEFLAYSISDTCPEEWVFTEVPASVNLYTPMVYPSRGSGRCYYLSFDEAFLQQTIPITKVPEVLTLTGRLGSHETDVSEVILDVLDASGNVLERWSEKYVSDLGVGAGSLYSVVVNATIKFTTRDCASLRLSIGSTLGEAVVFPFVLSVGYFTNNLRPFNDIILYTNPLTNASYTDDVFSTSTATILYTTFNVNYLNRQVKGLIFRVRAKDSGSAGAAAGAVYVGLASTTTLPQTRLELSGVTNSIYREIEITVWGNDPINLGDPSFYLDIGASGAGTLTLTLQVIGLIT
jgi:hypothetical protein